jgi:catechol 2,3-dioxygenase-like lactoylglutathione lyase family enzyme
MIGYVSLVVRDYDEAIQFYTETLGFRLVEDTFLPAQQKRWVLVAPPGSTETKLLLARAVGGEQAARVGNQTGGRVFLFLHTDDFWRDYNAYKSRGVVFVRPPSEEAYGTVAVFADLYGNLWDLVQPKTTGAAPPDDKPASNRG